VHHANGVVRGAVSPPLRTLNRNGSRSSLGSLSTSSSGVRSRSFFVKTAFTSSQNALYATENTASDDGYALASAA